MSFQEQYWHRKMIDSKVSNASGSDNNLNESGDLEISSPHATSSGIAPLDITTIKHIYEKALLISKLEEEAQANEIDLALSKIDDFSLESSTPFGGVKSRSLEGVDGKTIRNGMTDKWKRDHIQASDFTLDHKVDLSWSPTESDVLRQYYKRTKEENSRLRLLLNVREEELSLLREKYKSQEAKLENISDELKEVQKNNAQTESLNKQLKLHCGHLENEIKKLKEDFNYCQEGRNRLAKEVLRLEKDFNLEREARAKLELNLHQVLQEKQKDILYLEENWKTIHNDEVSRLNRVITDLNQKLSKEEDVRRCIQQGLDSLHRHLPQTPSMSETHSMKWNSSKH